MSFAGTVAFVLEREGGFVNDPADRGGPTKYGITKATAERHGLDVAKLRITDAVGIYERDYWQGAGCNLIRSDALALCHMDAAVNHGPRAAILLLQDALGVPRDGVFGSATAAALAAAADPLQVVVKYLILRAAKFRAIVAGDPTQAKFLRGWLARCRHVARECGIAPDTSYAG